LPHSKRTLEVSTGLLMLLARIISHAKKSDSSYGTVCRIRSQRVLRR